MLFFFMACMSKTNQRLDHIEARLDQLEKDLEQPSAPTSTYSPPKTQTRPPVEHQNMEMCLFAESGPEKPTKTIETVAFYVSPRLFLAGAF